MLLETQLLNVLHGMTWKLVEVYCFVVKVDLHVFDEVHAFKEGRHQFRAGWNNDLDHQVLKHFFLLYQDGVQQVIVNFVV